MRATISRPQVSTRVRTSRRPSLVTTKRRSTAGRRPDLRNPEVPLVCVDLNGVLDTYTGWKDPEHFDPPRPGAREFLEQLTAHGFRVVIFTTRHPVGVRRWLREHGLSDLVHAITDRKPPAHVFVDDRAVCFQGDFEATLRNVLAFRAHWEPE
jgi:beta-phosphoglucomutase-like phosphatase (HAD superfamily)